MAILENVQNPENVDNRGAEQAKAIRKELGSLLNSLYPGGLRAAGQDLGISYNTLRRAVSLDAKDATATVDLGMVLSIYVALLDKFPNRVDSFEDFFAHATRHIR